MLEYVLDAAAEPPPRRVPWSSTRRRPRRCGLPWPGRRTRRSRTSHEAPGDAVRAALDALPADVDEVLVVSGDVPLVAAGLLAALLEARGADHAVITLVAVDAIDPAGLGRVVRDDGWDGRADRRGEGRLRRRARHRRGQCRRCMPSTPRGCAAGSATFARPRRPASCTSPTSSRSRAPTAGSSPPSRWTTTGALDRDQRPGPARRRGVGHAGRASTTAGCGTA